MSFNITILSDAESWINAYIPDLVKELEKDGHNVTTVYKPNDIGSGDFVFYLGCGQIVSSAILRKNRHNLVVHESDLPKGKGWSPLTWQILEGKNNIPVCLFEAAESVDSGKIYLRETIEFNGTELVDELRKVQAEVSIRMCLRFVREYPVIAEKGVAQESDSTFYKKRTKEESRLDPDKTIREQFNLLRVVDNEIYPAFFELGGEKYILKINKAARQSKKLKKVRE